MAGTDPDEHSGYTHTLTTAGVVFGWAAYEAMLAKQPIVLNAGQLNLCFTLGGCTSYLANMVFGPILDSRGARVTNACACAVMLAGALLVAFADDLAPRLTAGPDALSAYAAVMTTGFVLLGLGGPGVQIPTLRIAMLFPDKQELIGSLNASLFDASCFVFFAMQLIQERWQVSLKSLFLAYAAWIVLLFLSSLAFFGDLELESPEEAAAPAGAEDKPAKRDRLPPEARPLLRQSEAVDVGAAGGRGRGEASSPLTMPYASGSGSFQASFMEAFLAHKQGEAYGQLDEEAGLPKTDSHLSIKSLASNKSGGSITAASDLSLPDLEAREVKKAAEGVSHAQLGFAEAVRTKEFVALSFVTAVHILRLNFIVGTLDRQLANTLPEAQAASWSKLFSTLLPLGGLSAPATAWLLKNHMGKSYAATTGLGFFWGVAVLVALNSSRPAVLSGGLVASFACISVGRQLVYSIVFATMPLVFGMRHLGKLLMTVNICVFCTGLLQFPIASLPDWVFGGNWWQTNILMVAMLLPLIFIKAPSPKRGGRGGA